MSEKNNGNFKRTTKGFDFDKLSDEELKTHFEEMARRKKMLFEKMQDTSFDEQEKERQFIYKFKAILNDLEELKSNFKDVDKHLEDALASLQLFMYKYMNKII